MFQRIVVLIIFTAFILSFSLAQTGGELEGVVVETVMVESGGQSYPAYMASPEAEGSYPGIVLLHSFRGLQEGYKTFTREFAAAGYVVLSVEWQTFGRQPSDATVKQLSLDSIDFLKATAKVSDKIGLTGFCAGGRYTMLLLPQIEAFDAGFAWYGFPKNGEPSAMDLVADLNAPLYIVHGTKDRPSPIADIYDYAQALDEANKYFELKVYQGEPHGFMVNGVEVNRNEAATDAFSEMLSFFERQLKN